MITFEKLIPPLTQVGKGDTDLKSNIILAQDFSELLNEFSVDEDGKVFCTNRGISRLIGLSAGTLTVQFKRVLNGNPIEWLKPLTPLVYEALNKDANGVNKWNIGSDLAIEIISHYAPTHPRAVQFLKSTAKKSYVEFIREAKGCQSEKQQVELILESRLLCHVLDEALTWEKCFPDEFFVAYCQMSGNARGSRACANFIARYIYKHFHPRFFGKLREKNPCRKNSFKRLKAYHQLLDEEFKRDMLIPHIRDVMGVCLLTRGGRNYRRNHIRRFPNSYSTSETRPVALVVA